MTTSSSTMASATGEPTTGDFPSLECPSTLEGPDDAPFFGDLLLELEFAELAGVCDDLVAPISLDPKDKWKVLVTYPAVEDGSPENEDFEELWDPGRKPLLVFEHGSGGQMFDQYAHIFRPLAREGIITASIQGSSTDEPERRAARILCTARWFATLWPDRNERLNCRFALMGHSSGGLGALKAARMRGPEDPTALMDLRALVGIAPREKGEGYFPAEKMAPLLLLQGSRDEQIQGDGMIIFDNTSPEKEPVDKFGKAIVWAYDVDHDAFGGGAAIENFSGVGSDIEMRAKGETLAREYVGAFLRWQLLGEDPAALRKRFTGEVVPDALDNPLWWDYLPDAPGGGEPAVLTAFTVDQRRWGEARLLIDTFEREVGGLSPAEPSGALVTVQPASFAEQVKIGTATNLAAGTNPDNKVARVDWSIFEDPEPGSLAWDFEPALDLDGFSHLSLRAANVILVPDILTCEVIEPDDPIQFQITLSDGVHDIAILTDVVIPQDLGLVSYPNSDVPSCVFHQFFRTLRIPLNEFCVLGPLDLSNIERLTFTFGSLGGPQVGSVMLDGVEFTRSGFDEGSASLCQ